MSQVLVRTGEPHNVSRSNNRNGNIPTIPYYYTIECSGNEQKSKDETTHQAVPNGTNAPNLVDSTTDL